MFTPALDCFSFYDQIHTTGMDIKQTPDAIAVATIGKDMVFRDFAQGCFRMRGIGIGQTIINLLIPEVASRITKDLEEVDNSFDLQLKDATVKQNVPLAHLFGPTPSGIAPLSTLKQEIEVGADVLLWKSPTETISATVVKVHCLCSKHPDGTINWELCVPAWLMINSMNSETLQDMQLSSQEVYNALRKSGLKVLRDEISHAQDMVEGSPLRVRRFTALPDD